LFHKKGAEGYMPISVHILSSYIYDCITNSTLKMDLLMFSIYG